MRRLLLALALALGLGAPALAAVPAVTTCDFTGTFCQPLPYPASQIGLVGTVINIKTAPGLLYSAYCTNSNTSTGYAIQIFNATASNVTLGTTNATFQTWVPESGATSSGVGVVYIGPTIGAYFNIAMSIAATTALGGGSGAPSSTINCYETVQ
jgi:hypothetical protein